MRYIKVFFLVFLFFLVMMLFVQNQASFSDMVTLKFDPMFAPAMTSAPLPRYALLLISFAIGAAVVLIMLMWDRVTLSGRLSAARRLFLPHCRSLALGVQPRGGAFPRSLFYCPRFPHKMI